jgi:polyisoprenoid-binding protein YceI
MRSLSLVLLIATSLSSAPLAVKRFDTNHSTIGFRIPIAGGMSEVEGKFTDFAIDVAYDDQNVANSSVTAVIQAASIDTGIPDRDKHLRSADFFDVAKYPEVKFVSSSIEKRPDGFVAHGTFTMHGVSKEIALPFRQTGMQKIPDKNAIILGFAAKTQLDRRDYGLNWKHSVDPLFVGNDVDIEIRLITKLIPLPG